MTTFVSRRYLTCKYVLLLPKLRLKLWRVLNIHCVYFLLCLHNILEIHVFWHNKTTWGTVSWIILWLNVREPLFISPNKYFSSKNVKHRKNKAFRTVVYLYANSNIQANFSNWLPFLRPSWASYGYCWV